MNPFSRLFNPDPDPVYYTPQVIAQQVIENQTGANVTIINPPLQSPDRPKRKNWKHSWRIMGRWYITLSNCSVKRRDTCGYTCTSKQNNIIKANKEKLLARQGGQCAHCHQPLTIQQAEYHHVLPWSRFPDLRLRIANGLVLCHKCHKEVHCNPYKNIRLMEAKAKELGINLSDIYGKDL